MMGLKILLQNAKYTCYKHNNIIFTPICILHNYGNQLSTILPLHKNCSTTNPVHETIPQQIQSMEPFHNKSSPWNHSTRSSLVEEYPLSDQSTFPHSMECNDLCTQPISSCQKIAECKTHNKMEFL